MKQVNTKWLNWLRQRNNHWKFVSFFFFFFEEGKNENRLKWANWKFSVEFSPLLLLFLISFNIFTGLSAVDENEQDNTRESTSMLRKNEGHPKRDYPFSSAFYKSYEILWKNDREEKRKDTKKTIDPKKERKKKIWRETKCNEKNSL